MKRREALGGFPFYLAEGSTPPPYKSIDGASLQVIEKVGETMISVAVKWTWERDGGIYGMWIRLPLDAPKQMREVAKDECLHYVYHWVDMMEAYGDNPLLGKAFLKYPKIRWLLVKFMRGKRDFMRFVYRREKRRKK